MTDKNSCEYCGEPLPLGVDKATRRVRSHHFQNCANRIALVEGQEDECCDISALMDEIERLRAENERLRAELNALWEQEPVATVQGDYEETELGYCQFHTNTVYGQNLYAAPKPGGGR